jgi:hypothetical protein
MARGHQLRAAGTDQVLAVVAEEHEKGAVRRARLGETLELLQYSSVIRPY